MVLYMALNIITYCIWERSLISLGFSCYAVFVYHHGAASISNKTACCRITQSREICAWSRSIPFRLDRRLGVTITAASVVVAIDLYNGMVPTWHYDFIIDGHDDTIPKRILATQDHGEWMGLLSGFQICTQGLIDILIRLSHLSNRDFTQHTPPNIIHQRS